MGGFAPHRRLRPQAPDAFGLNPFSQLVIGYHWYIYYLGPQFTTNVEYKIDHISKTKNCKIVKFSAKFVSEHCASFGAYLFLQKILKILYDHISKTKNRKNDFSFVSEHCATFWTKSTFRNAALSSRNDIQTPALKSGQTNEK